jgi:hypothetical protein
VRTLGLAVGDQVQVSMNLLDPASVGPAAVYDAVAAEATIARAELVGLVPTGVIDAIDPARWSELDLAADRTIEARLAARTGRSGGGVGGGSSGQRPLPADATPLTLAHAAPDAELLAVGEGVLEAVLTYHATAAHLFRLTSGRTPFWEEQVGVDPEAVGEILPRLVGCSGQRLGRRHDRSASILSPPPGLAPPVGSGDRNGRRTASAMEGPRNDVRHLPHV